VLHLYLLSLYVYFIMKERILQLIQEEAQTNAEFADKIGISTSSLSHILTGRNKPSLDVVMHIHKAYPTINLDWLLYGEGDMKKEVDPNVATGLPYENSENTEITNGNPVRFEFRKENAFPSPDNVSKNTVQEEVKYIEKPQPKIVEIRIFFDNGTYQVFRPEKS